MKLKLWMLAMAVVFTAMARGATNDLTGLLQKGLFEEEANRDLSAAIANYQSLASAFDQDRQLAATAIFRLGECYRKLGRTNDAVAQYERIVHEFGDQPTLVTLSRQNLAGLGHTGQSTTQPQSPNVSEPARELELVKKIQAMPFQQILQAAPTVLTDATLINLIYQYNQTDLDLVRLRTDHAEEHNEVKKTVAIQVALEKKIKERLNGLSEALSLELGTSATTSGGGTTSTQGTATTNDEERQIRNIQAMIQNSPDLINAPGGDGKTPLQLAAEKGQLVVAKYLLDHGADVNGGVGGSGTPLFLAADNGHKAMVELLLARGADVNSTHSPNPLLSAVSKGFTEVVEVLLANKADVNTAGILRAAASGGRTNLIQLLIDHGADVNAVDGGNSPLHIAAGANKPDAARILIASKADVNARNKEGNTPLHEAAGVGSAEIVSLLLDSGANADATNQVNITPLSIAVANGRVDAARALLEHKADPNHSGPTPSGSWPNRSYSSPPQPLIYAASGGDKNEILKLLLDAGANPEGDSESALYPPLYYAMDRNNVDAVQLLLQHGANPNGMGRANQSPLNAVLDNNKYTRIVQLLLDKGADPNARGQDGLVPLMRTSDPEVARWLIEHKADVNARTEEGATPLMLATHRSEEFLKVLLANGAQPDLQDTNGDSALHYAVRQASTNLVAALLARGANPNIQNNNGATPLDLAKGIYGPMTAPNSGPGLRPLRMPGPNGSISPEAEKQIADMLVKAGGLANLPKRDRIEVRRGFSYDSLAFVKGLHDWNRFSLLESIAGAYGLLGQNSSGEWPAKTDLRQNLFNFDLRFPDFKKVVIYRRTANSAKQTAMNIDVESILSTGDCSRDVWLEWGDVIEIPEADHPVDQHWPGLPDPDVASLIKCVTRQVTVIIKGESTTLKLAPGLTDTPMTRFSQQWNLTRASFMLRSVLDNSKLIRVSSDLSRVKVTRHDPVTKKTVEWVVDCTSPDQANLWVRDGDVIEVPEK